MESCVDRGVLEPDRKGNDLNFFEEGVNRAAGCQVVDLQK